jgi:flavin-dependent dehydrogenase|eukprot:COSAG01_NODE_5480_length_4231_cov_10.097484_4_plen_263_part_00
MALVALVHLATACCSGRLGAMAAAPPLTTHVLVYGATPAGCAAAIAAARQQQPPQQPPRLGMARRGHRLNVQLLDPSPYRVGGMTSGGLGHTDLGLGGREFGGITQEFYERVSAHYATQGDGGSQNTSATQCYQVESHVAQKVYSNMLREAGVVVTLGRRLVGVAKHSRSANLAHIRTVMSTSTSDGMQPLNISAAVFIDASYEGDLMAAAGVSYVVGRESKSQYGEESGGRMAPNDVLARYQFQVSETCSRARTVIESVCL